MLLQSCKNLYSLCFPMQSHYLTGDIMQLLQYLFIKYNMPMKFDLCWHNYRNVPIFWYATHHIKFVIKYTWLNGGHVEYDNNNDTTRTKVNTAAHWGHRGPLEHNLEPNIYNVQTIQNTDMCAYNPYML